MDDSICSDVVALALFLRGYPCSGMECAMGVMISLLAYPTTFLVIGFFNLIESATFDPGYLAIPIAVPLGILCYALIGGLIGKLVEKVKQRRSKASASIPAEIQRPSISNHPSNENLNKD